MTIKLRTIVVEDEEKDRKVLEKILSEYYSDCIELVGSAAGVESGVQLIQEQSPDLVLLDIVLHGNRYGAFQLLEEVERSFQIIFITGQNSSEYYIKALRLNCIDYITKPTCIEDFELPLQRAMEENQKQKESQRLNRYVERLELLIDMMKQQKQSTSIALPIEYGHIIVELEEIVLCQSAANYTEFTFTNKAKRLISGNLKHYEELFSEFTFARVHKQTMINLSHIVEFSRKEGGKVLLTNGETVYIGEHWKKSFTTKYRDYIGASLVHV